jgi:hypothetical protein
MHCPHCSSSYIRRSRRQGMQDLVAAWMKRWPYRCQTCSLRFWSNRRYPIRPVFSWQSPSEAAPRPTAKVEIRATSQTELDQILLNLNRALEQFQPATGTVSAPSVMLETERRLPSLRP